MGVKRSEPNSLAIILISFTIVIGIPSFVLKCCVSQDQPASQKEITVQQDDISFNAEQEWNNASGQFTSGASFSQTYSQDKEGFYILTGPVMDSANLLSEEGFYKLQNFLLSLESQTSVQVAVLTVKSLNGKDIAEFSVEQASRWKLGQKDLDNGALLTISYDEHKIRIDTGYGTEGILTDAKCSRIIRNVIVPNFQAGNYEKGITEAVKNMVGIITGDASLVSKNVLENSSTKMTSSELAITCIFFLIFFAIIIHAITHQGKSSSNGIRVVPGGFSTYSNHYHSSRSGHHGGGFSGGGGGFGGGGAGGSW